MVSERIIVHTMLTILLHSTLVQLNYDIDIYSLFKIPKVVTASQNPLHLPVYCSSAFVFMCKTAPFVFFRLSDTNSLLSSQMQWKNCRLFFQMQWKNCHLSSQIQWENSRLSIKILWRIAICSPKRSEKIANCSHKLVKNCRLPTQISEKLPNVQAN